MQDCQVFLSYLKYALFFVKVGITLHCHVWKVINRYRKVDEKLLHVYSSDSVEAQGYVQNHKEETTDWDLTRYKNNLNCVMNSVIPNFSLLEFALLLIFNSY